MNRRLTFLTGITLGATLMLGATACEDPYAPEVRHEFATTTTPTTPPPAADTCVIIVPHGSEYGYADLESVWGHLDYTRTDGVGTWTDSLGTIVGYADEEDATIYNRPGCGPAYPWEGTN